MFRSSTVIREPALNLAKVIFTLKHSVKLCRYLRGLIEKLFLFPGIRHGNAVLGFMKVIH